MDAIGARRRSRQHELRARYREVPAVVLPDAEERQPDLISEHCLVDDVADRLGIADQLSRVVTGDVSEGVEAEFDRGWFAHVRVLSMRLHRTTSDARSFPRQTDA